MPLEPSSFERSFDCRLTSTQQVRRFVDGALTTWVIGEPEADILLIADELATNAVLHARSPFLVRVLRSRDRVRLEVEDGCDSPPRRRAAAPTSTSGRGLVLVEALAQGWGWHRRTGGKSVWAEVDVPA